MVAGPGQHMPVTLTRSVAEGKGLGAPLVPEPCAVLRVTSQRAPIDAPGLRLGHTSPSVGEGLGMRGIDLGCAPQRGTPALPRSAWERAIKGQAQGQGVSLLPHGGRAEDEDL